MQATAPAVPVTTALPTPKVTVEHGEPMASSVDVAKYFGKQHNNVVQAIDRLEINDDLRVLNFQQTEATRPNPLPNRAPIKSKAYIMTKKGFTLLVMGFTGKKAMQFKLAYIEAFEAMEQKLIQQREQMRPLPGKSYLVTFGQNGPIMREVGRILSRGEREELYEIIRSASHRLAELYDLPEAL